MDMEYIKEKIERWKLLVDIFLKEDKKVFIREVNGDLHFCKILSKDDDAVLIINFGPEQRAGTKENIYWYLINDIDEFKDEVKENA